MLKGLIIFVLWISNGNYLFAQDTLHWSEERKLLWSDFRGAIDQGDPETGARSSIYVYYILTPCEKVYCWNIKVVFDRETAWARNKSVELLVHEQVHFDIAELFARKIAKKFYEIGNSGDSVESVVDSLFNGLMDEHELFTHRYDNETNFSRNSEKQIEWNEFISAELNKYVKYKRKQGKVKSE
jgi:hypothetical protein